MITYGLFDSALVPTHARAWTAWSLHKVADILPIEFSNTFQMTSISVANNAFSFMLIPQHPPSPYTSIGWPSGWCWICSRHNFRPTVPCDSKAKRCMYTRPCWDEAGLVQSRFSESTLYRKYGTALEDVIYKSRFLNDYSYFDKMNYIFAIPSRSINNYTERSTLSELSIGSSININHIYFADKLCKSTQLKWMSSCYLILKHRVGIYLHGHFITAC